MKKMLLMALMAVLMASPALAQEKKTLVIATDATWPPMEFVNEDKELVGFAMDYMKAAAEEGGYDLKIVNAAWDGIFAGLLNNQYDAICSSVTITDERKKSMDFSTPYFTVSQAIIVPKDSTITTLEELKGKRAGSQISTTGTFAVKSVPDIESVTYDEVGLAVEDLYNGRLDAVVCDDPVAANFILENDRYKNKLKIAAVLSNPDDEENYGVAVVKGNKEVLDLINKGIAGVKAKGIDKVLNEKWITAAE